MPPSLGHAFTADHGGPFRGGSAAPSRRLRGLTFARQKSLVLFGETRLGKTMWARSLGKHMYFCGLYSGSEAMRYKDVDYAVFDDMQLKFVPQYKNWLGCQKQFQVKQLYKDPEIIDWGKPCIWLSNDDPRHEAHLTENDIKWLEGNCVFVEVTSAIFRANTE